MTAVDLGAAPGGWTWQLVQRGLKVIAVDNGPLKGAAAEHPAIKHLRQDGFRFRPQRPVDWLVCDMVEQPQRVATLMTEWFIGGLTHACHLQPQTADEETRRRAERCAQQRAHARSTTKASATVWRPSSSTTTAKK